MGTWPRVMCVKELQKSIMFYVLELIKEGMR
jgi:hypothetical protein